MHVGLRVDANSTVGTGHLHRCLNIAAELSMHGHDVTLISGRHSEISKSDRHPPDLRTATLDSSISTFSSGDGLSPTPPAEITDDAELTAVTLARSDIDTVIVDHYSITDTWVSCVKERTGCRVMVIDDVARAWPSADILLDSALGSSERYAHLATNSVALLGPSYVPLNQKYKAFADREIIDSSILKLMVFFGGVDAPNATGRVLAELSSATDRELRIRVVVGSQNPNRADLVQRFQGENVEFAEPADSMFAHLIGSDIALGAGGTATWERLCVGIPSISIAIAENQVKLSQELGVRGCLRFLGRLDETPSGSIREAVDALASDRLACEAMSLKGRTLVDGYGTARIRESLSPSSMEHYSLRDVREADCLTLFRWVNDPVARRASLHTAEVDWKAHRRWFLGLLGNPNRVVFIAEVHGTPVGQIRMERINGRVRLSYSVDPTQRGRGVGRWLVEHGVRRIRQRWTEPILAEVRIENEPSLRIFRVLGFREEPSPEAGVVAFILDAN